MSKKKLNKTVWYGSDVDLQGNAILPPLAESREDLNGIHEGEIYLHNQDDDPGIWVRTNKGNVKRIGFNKKDFDLSEYLKKQVWDTAWELRTTEEGESYIFCKLPFISQHGVTLYADGGNIDLPSLYAGIPVDETTITKREDGTLMLNPNLELGGLDETALQKYLDDYNYAKLSDIPSLDGYAKLTDVDSRINDLVNGAPAAYDTLKEIADVLQGNVNSIGDIITTLGTKADKTYVDTELAKYIPIAGDTEVTGIKNFLNGLKVGGLPISKYEGHDDVIYIDANVVLRGGLTQYAVDPVTIPSIIESLPQAGYEAKGVASFSSDFFVIDANGKVSIIPDSVGLNEEELEEWLADSDYATKTYADDRYFLASNFTKTNIAAKLGISDWALAATKPSYTTKEVTEDTNLYFTNQRAIDALAETLKAYVTLKGTQTIEGEKNFTGGLKVNGSPIVYDSENGYWLLQGNLLITGGLTQYVDDGSVNLPNLYDGLPIDRDTIYWEETANGKVLKAKVAEGGITSITSQMVVEALGFTPYDASNPNGYITSDALNGYLPLSGGTIDSGTNWTELYVKSTNANLGFISYGSDSYIQSNVLRITGVGGVSGYLLNFTFDNITVGTEGHSVYHSGMIPTIKTHLGLATVATSGSYNDLSNKPTIPTSLKSPYALSWSGYSSGSYDGSAAKSITIPTNTNQLTNGAGFITSSVSGSINLNGDWENDFGINFNEGGGATYGFSLLYGAGDLFKLVTRANSTTNTTIFSVTRGSSVLNFANTPTVNGNSVWHSGNFTPSNYLPLSGGTLTGPLTMKGEQYTGNYSLNMSNSDIIGVNAIFMSDTAQNGTEGIQFLRSNNTYDSLWALDGTLYFSPNGNNLTRTGLYSTNYTVAFTHSNVASATKLQTARTIFGVSFDGTKDINGKAVFTTDSTSAEVITLSATSASYNCIKYNNVSGGYNWSVGINSTDYYLWNSYYSSSVFRVTNEGAAIVGMGGDGVEMLRFNTHKTWSFYQQSKDTTSALALRSSTGSKSFYIQSENASNIAEFFASATTPYTRIYTKTLIDGNVGIGTTSPAYKLDISHSVGDMIRMVSTGSNYACIIYQPNGGSLWSVGSNSSNQFYFYHNGATRGYLDASGNLLVKGGITQYSDIRKKTKLNDVELTLSQVANAPLIEHYYNSDDKKTTHVGSIAQYWAEMNDWFCKLDSDGFYTMEIQNAALASAISVARELERYESKTDKKIRLLKKRINELEDEIEQLKK